MQYTKNGANIPERLIEAHEDGKVVFFCGAGISYPAGLPLFSGLVKDIYTELGAVFTPIENQAFKNYQYDATIDLLERRIPGGRVAVRKAINRVLKPKLKRKGATTTHEALLTLAKNNHDDTRLITTNFDRIFEHVLAKNKNSTPTFSAPLLPVPKSRWHGLVYLHGLLPKTPDDKLLNHLVISSGDFGLAYLVERWASRFVTDLFRNFTICFVGYSINDPVLRYMMDAIAADRRLGEATPEAFAFGSFKSGGQSDAEVEWEAKGVTPVLYEDPPGGKHRALHETIKAWADTYRDGISGKQAIITRYASGKPTPIAEDDQIGRVVWAICDRSGAAARTFADQTPLPPIEWLKYFSAQTFGHQDLTRFGVQPNQDVDTTLQYSIASRPSPYTHSAWMTLVTWRRGFSNSNHLDPVMTHLARWLARHLDTQEFMNWVIRSGGSLHPEFIRHIEDQIEKNGLESRFLAIWRMLISGRVYSASFAFDGFRWLNRFNLYGWSVALKKPLLTLLEPKVSFSEASKLSELDTETDHPRRIKEIADWEIVLVGGDSIETITKAIDKSSERNRILSGMLSDLTSLLLEAMELMAELEGANSREDNSYWHMPSISPHEQNKSFHEWTVLIELCRDAWLAAIEFDQKIALVELSRWHTLKFPVFRRLILFAATNRALVSSSVAVDYMLDDAHFWLWSEQTQREIYRLIVARSADFKLADLRRLTKAIATGPTLKLHARGEAEPRQFSIDRDIWLRLAKMSLEIQLPGKEQKLLSRLSLKYPAWTISNNEQEEFPIWMGSGDEFREHTTTPRKSKDLVAWLRSNPTSDFWKEDDWRQRCRSDFRRTVSALRYLAHRGEWPTYRWREALQAYSEDQLALRSWHIVAPVIKRAPEPIFKELDHAISYWIRAVAPSITNPEDHFFSLVERILDVTADDKFSNEGSSFTRALNHPIGHATEALFRWWYTTGLKDDQGISGQFIHILNRMVDVRIEAFRYGRIILATHLIALFRVDPVWTKHQLLPLFDWCNRDEARPLWEAHLWNPRLYRPLAAAFKESFLETVNHYADLNKSAEQYASLLALAGLEPDDTFQLSELQIATAKLPPKGLTASAYLLMKALADAGDKRSEYWDNRLKPYLKRIWPKSTGLISEDLSEVFARLCVVANDIFPKVFEFLESWIIPIENWDYCVRELNRANLCARYPEASLNFLDKLISEKITYVPEELQKCLAAISDAEPKLKNRSAYKRLNTYLIRVGTDRLIRSSS